MYRQSLFTLTAILSMKRDIVRIIISTSVTLFIIINNLLANTVDEIIAIKDPKKQIELALLYSESFGKDTIFLKKHIAPLLERAKSENNIPLQWAYYMQMADGFSIAIDNTNPTSDYYYRLANKLTKDHNYPELEITGLIRQGYYNFIYRKVIEAFPFYLKANDLKAKVDIDKIPLPIKHYQFISNFFSYIGDYSKAIEYLEAALPFCKETSRERINLINSMSIYNLNLNKTENSLYYLNIAMHEAELAKDSVWIGIISGNLAEYEWKKGNKTKALDLVKKNIALSIRYNDTQDAMRANLILADYYISLDEWDLASQHIIISKKMMEDKPYYLQYKMNAAFLLSKIAKHLNKKEDELTHLNTYILLRDSLEKRNNVKEMQKIIWQSEREKYDQTIQNTELNKQQSKRMLIYITIFSILIFCIILLLINKSKSKIKIKNANLEKDQLTLKYEKQLVDQELIILKNSLEDFTNTIKHNDTIIKQLRNDVAKAPKQNAEHSQKIVDQLNQMLESHIMTDERWISFKNVFDKVYPGYLKEIKENYIKLTDNDLRIIALQKLELNNTAMSELLCISLEGIKKAKQRLKKKMEHTS